MNRLSDLQDQFDILKQAVGNIRHLLGLSAVIPVEVRNEVSVMSPVVAIKNAANDVDILRMRMETEFGSLKKQLKILEEFSADQESKGKPGMTSYGDGNPSPGVTSWGKKS